jgi:hypothetical protein
MYVDIPHGMHTRLHSSCALRRVSSVISVPVRARDHSEEEHDCACGKAASLVGLGRRINRRRGHGSRVYEQRQDGKRPIDTSSKDWDWIAATTD